MQLTHKNVETVLLDCLFADADIAGKTAQQVIADPNCVVVEGVMSKFGFNRLKLEKHANHIKEMLKQLPAQFGEHVGGGWSFLEAIHNSDDGVWGGHRDVDALMCLGLAIGQVIMRVPRTHWAMLPGGLPYFAVKD